MLPPLLTIPGVINRRRWPLRYNAFGLIFNFSERLVGNYEEGEGGRSFRLDIGFSMYIYIYIRNTCAALLQRARSCRRVYLSLKQMAAAERYVYTRADTYYTPLVRSGINCKRENTRARTR